jgi:hypothetical protein
MFAIGCGVGIAAAGGLLAPGLATGNVHTLPDDTFPYQVTIRGEKAGNLNLTINGNAFLRDYDFRSNEAFSFSAAFLKNDEENRLEYRQDSGNTVDVTVTRGDSVICSSHAVKGECLFRASMAYDLQGWVPSRSIRECVDLQFLDRFFSNIDEHKRAFVTRVFSLQQHEIAERCSQALDPKEFSLSAHFLAAPSPRELLHARFVEGRSLTLVTGADIAQTAMIGPSDDREIAAGALIFSLENEQRFLPIRSARDAYGLMTLTI